MNIYDRYILPRLIDLAMRHGEIARYRAKIVPRARGAVVEIGVGSGLNLPFYAPGVERLTAIDPSEALLGMTGRKTEGARFPVDLVATAAETLPLDDACADTVVTTFTLCTIGDPARALREMKRVLKPGGVLLFAEHGLAPERSVQRWQQRLNPLWKRLAGGCNLDRRIDALLANAGFDVLDLEKGYAKGPKPMAYIYAGCAMPGAGAAAAPKGSGRG